jgi:signal transduction histidine kinase
MEQTVTTPKPHRGLAGFVHPLVEGRTYVESADLLLDLAFGVLWFTLFTTAIATGLGTLILLIGPPILAATFMLARAGGWWERRRVALLLGTAIDDPIRKPAKGNGLLQKLAAPFRDRTTWKELFYLWLVQPPLSIVNFTTTLVAWVVPLWAITLPTYAIAWDGAAPEVLKGQRLDTPLETLVVAALGLLLLPVAPWIVRGLAAVDAAVARGMLSPSRTEALEGRIDTLRETQARSVDIAIADRRQIERDLHDGAQQRLLALGMELGRALEKFETDPEAARALVGDAHQELQRAVAELRNLARGIHPAVLTDRGLDAALSALAARSPVPVRLEVSLGERPPASTEATAYFIVAEALTNAVKHGRPSRIDVRVRRNDRTLRIEVADDGVGGAAEQAGGGLAGLADRASSVEGTLRITSPPGGPTVVAAELPCAS